MTLIFTHIPKCGGTTFRNILEQIYSMTFLLYPPDIKDQIRSLISLDHSEITEIDLIAGHVGFGLHNKLSAYSSPGYITMLRDPVDRVISYFNHCKTYSDTNISNYVRDMSLEEFIDGTLSKPIENYQTRFLSGIPNLTICTEHTLEKAIANLETHYVSWGLTHRFEESLIVFKNKLNWGEIPVYQKLNTSKRVAEITPKILDKLRNKNQLDYRLFEYAQTRFNEHLSSIDESKKDLELLNARLKAYGKGYREGANNWVHKKSGEPSIKEIFQIIRKKVTRKIL